MYVFQAGNVFVETAMDRMDLHKTNAICLARENQMSIVVLLMQTASFLLQPCVSS